MNWYKFLYLIPYVVSATISSGIALYTWRRRSVAGAGAYAAYALFAASYTVGFIFELISPSLEAKVFWDNTQFVGMFAVPVSLFIFSRRYTGNRSAHPLRLWLLLSIVPFVFLILVFSDSLHGLIHPALWLVPGQPFAALVYDFSLAVWVMAIYVYGLILASIACLFIRFIRPHRLYRIQVAIVSLGILIPVGGSVFTIFGLAPTFHRDMAPITLAIGNLIVAWGLFHYRLLDIVPIARNAIIEAMTDAVLVLDAQNRVVDMNPAAEQLIRRSGSEAIGKPVREVLSSYEHLIDRFRDTEQVYSEIVLGSGKDQQFFELTILPLRERKGRLTGRLIMAHDITEREQSLVELSRYRENLEKMVKERTAELKREIEEREQAEEARARLEDQLLQSQKIEAIGTLAGGIAHDFNNLLTTILGYADMILTEAGLTNTVEEGALEIQKSAQRASDLTQQLLSFSRKQILEPKVIDINLLLQDRRRMLERLVGENIDLGIRLEPDIGGILADPWRIEQVIVNLAVNARDAMPLGGKLTLETRNIHLDESNGLDNPELTAGEYVLLTVSDTGQGMDEATQRHVFEPFFTTKEVGKGTGLGLSSAYGIVKQSGGVIEVDSGDPGKGSTFKIYLPHAAGEENTPEAVSSEKSIDRGAETILLVEDEAALRKITARTLEKYGYRVVSAGNGEEALETAKRRNFQDIDLLVTDVVMPKMNGKELADLLRETYPELKVLYISGYPDDVIVHHGVLDEGVKLLQKPFTSKILAKKVRQVLEGGD